MSMKINARAKAPAKVASGEKARSLAIAKKYETTLRNATNTTSVIKIVVSIVPFSWLKFAMVRSSGEDSEHLKREAD